MTALKQNLVDTGMKKCLSCGANMIFDPDKQKLYCPHCESMVELSFNVKAREIDIRTAFQSERTWESDTVTNVFSCENCGAKVVFAEGESAKSCPFCGTAHVTKLEDLSGIKPSAILPFGFGVKKAVELSKKWAGRSLFAPRSFKKSLNPSDIKGVYVPAFTFDSVTTSTYSGKIGKRRTRVVGYGKNRRTETYIEWRYISGTFYGNYDDILISSGEKIDQAKLNKLMPYETSQCSNYEENFLLGFMAYHYDKNVERCWEDAKAIIDADLKRAILRQYSFDMMSYLNVSTIHERVTFKYVMLPVYTGLFKYSKNNYNFYINGRTGKVTGKRPISPLKVILSVLLGAATLGLIGYLLYLSGVF